MLTFPYMSCAWQSRISTSPISPEDLTDISHSAYWHEYKVSLLSLYLYYTWIGLSSIGSHIQWQEWFVTKNYILLLKYIFRTLIYICVVNSKVSSHFVCHNSLLIYHRSAIHKWNMYSRIKNTYYICTSFIRQKRSLTAPH